MEGVSGKRKGIVMSFAAFLLVTILLALALQLVYQSSKTGDMAFTLVNMDKVSERHANIGAQIAIIARNYLNISIWNTTFILSENMPLSTGLTEDINDLSEFEQNFSDMNIGMDLANLKNGTLILQPNSARITQNQTNFILNATGNNPITSYEITLILSQGVADIASWSVLNNVSSSDPNALNVSVLIEDQEYLGAGGTGLYASFSAIVNKSAISTINITNTATGVSVGYVKFVQNGTLEINPGSSVYLKALTRFTSPVYVEANDTLAVISRADARFNKTSTIRIA